MTSPPALTARSSIATGPDGRLYRLERGREVVLVTGVDAKQITRFAARPGAGARAAAFATANPGRVLSPTGADQSPATFTSAVRDSKSLATWGLIRWEAAGSGRALHALGQHRDS